MERNANKINYTLFCEFGKECLPSSFKDFAQFIAGGWIVFNRTTLTFKQTEVFHATDEYQTGNNSPTI